MPSRNKAALLLTLCAVALLGAGCRRRTVQAAPPIVVVPAPAETRPAETKAPATPANKTENPEAKPSTEPATPPAEPSAPAPKKPAPRPAATHPAPAQAAPAPETPPAETPVPKPTPPQMSPRLSPSQQAEYEKRTTAAIAVAEKNLQAVEGRQLNSNQTDMAGKIRGFLAQAREAMGQGDWMRARNLAQKAQVLSVELVNSL